MLLLRHRNGRQQSCPHLENDSRLWLTDLGAQAHNTLCDCGWPKINTEQSYSVKRKINPTRLIEFRGGYVTESHSRTGYTCHFSKKPPGLSPVCTFVLCFCSILFSLSVPLSGYSIYTSA